MRRFILWAVSLCVVGFFGLLATGRGENMVYHTQMTWLRMSGWFQGREDTTLDIQIRKIERSMASLVPHIAETRSALSETQGVLEEFLPTLDQGRDDADELEITVRGLLEKARESPNPSLTLELNRQRSRLESAHKNNEINKRRRQALEEQVALREILLAQAFEAYTQLECLRDEILAHRDYIRTRQEISSEMTVDIRRILGETNEWVKRATELTDRPDPLNPERDAIEQTEAFLQSLQEN